ncbi:MULTISPECIES: zinc-binding dehydrogenase [Streptomyces]|uniref:zinc-binding dehydrogenase n=1 Tax=Streptomyces TaxID=1883 RepID=UPI00358FC5E1
MLVEADHEGMWAIAELVEKGQLRALVDATFPLAEGAEAHAHGETYRRPDDREDRPHGALSGPVRGRLAVSPSVSW